MIALANKTNTTTVGYTEFGICLVCPDASESFLPPKSFEIGVFFDLTYIYEIVVFVLIWSPKSVNGCCVGIYSMNKLELLSWYEILLVFHHYDLMRVDSIYEHFERSIIYVVEVNSCHNGTELKTVNTS